MNTTFSRSGYADFLAGAQNSGYQIRPMRDALKAAVMPTLLLRHDVDLSLRLALAMAELEHEHGVAATYLILPHNDFYAPFSPEGRRILLQMIQLGHEIGLHCDAAVYPQEATACCRAIQRDIETLQDITGRKVVSASQHNPTVSRAVDLGGLVDVDAYAPWLRQKFVYVSDSVMSWRSLTPWDLLASRKNLQLLTHPIWWMAPGASRHEKFAYLKADEAESQSAKLDDALAYMEGCLADRARLDTLAAQRQNELQSDNSIGMSGNQT
jgi:hypothetical protein